MVIRKKDFAVLAGIVDEARTRLTGLLPEGGLSADAAAQTWGCLTVELVRQRARRSGTLAAQLLRLADPSWRDLLAESLGAAQWMSSPHTPLSSAFNASLAAAARTAAARLQSAADDLYEPFLVAYDQTQRGRHGVFYTPAPLARFLVGRVDRLLRDQFQLPWGIADPTVWRQRTDLSPPSDGPPDAAIVQVIDPAAGAGAFLIETIDLAWRTMGQQWRALPAGQQLQKWQEYVTLHLLPRLSGNELLLPAAALCRLRLIWKLQDTGYDCREASRIDVARADTLSAERPAGVPAERPPASVVLGNPPFFSLGQPSSAWMERLLRGGVGGGSYFEVDGRPLGERKVWLNDDYVKFLRWTQWRIAATGLGIAGLVVNHGWLNNVTFRGLRQQLLETFPQLEVIDLHGGVKGREQDPGGGRDENVFGVSQGIMLGVFGRPPGEAPRRASRADLWGARQHKLDSLAAPSRIRLRALSPGSPDYLLDCPPADFPEYRCGPRLTELMPLYTTAPVTARDRFVVDRSQAALFRRVSEFADLSIGDDEIRRRYFRWTRSPKYPPGDTRGWKLAEARRQLAGSDWPSHIRPCLYRPFDERHVLWMDSMVDWPRGEVTRHLLRGSNLALIARRQMLPGRPCSYFWATDKIALDGVIRSDNRGSESLFPLWIWGPQGRAANFDLRHVRRFSDVWQLVYSGADAGDLGSTFGAEDLLSYIYALFHCPAYRARYQDALRADFPRVPIVTSRQLFAELSRLGGRLLRLHVTPQAAPAWPALPSAPAQLAAGCPRLRQGRVEIQPGCIVESVAEPIWRFQVGGHQVARKWLRDRRADRLMQEDLQAYGQLLSAIEQTLQAMRQIDDLVAAAGGCSEVFT